MHSVSTETILRFSQGSRFHWFFSASSEVLIKLPLKESYTPRSDRAGIVLDCKITQNF